MIIEPGDMKFVPKRWGYERHIVNNDLYCGKELFIAASKFTSFHWHEIKDEVLHLAKGTMYMLYQGTTGDVQYIKMTPGMAFHVEPGLRHQMYAVSDVYIYEFSTKHSDEDSFRETKDLIYLDFREDFK